MQGPTIPYRPGRLDKDVAACTPDGRLPDATQGNKHLRDIFGRMGFNDQEIVALSGAHALGRCHTDRSGFTGPWTFSPTVVTNDYYTLLLNEKWQWKKWNGPKQVSSPHLNSKQYRRRKKIITDERTTARGQDHQDPHDAAHRRSSRLRQVFQAMGREVRQGQRPLLQGFLGCHRQALRAWSPVR